MNKKVYTSPCTVVYRFEMEAQILADSLFKSPSGSSSTSNTVDSEGGVYVRRRIVSNSPFRLNIDSIDFHN